MKKNKEIVLFDNTDYSERYAEIQQESLSLRISFFKFSLFL